MAELQVSKTEVKKEVTVATTEGEELSAVEAGPDPFSGKPEEPNPVNLTQEQWDMINGVLQIACSDSRFVEKAKTAIHMILTYAGEPEPQTVPAQKKSESSSGVKK